MSQDAILKGWNIRLTAPNGHIVHQSAIRFSRFKTVTACTDALIRAALAAEKLGYTYESKQVWA